MVWILGKKVQLRWIMYNNHNKFSKDGHQAVGIPLMAPQQRSQPLDNWAQYRGPFGKGPWNAVEIDSYICARQKHETPHRVDAHTLAHSRISYAQFFGAASSVSYFLALALSLVQSSQLKKTHRISAARFPACTEICFQTFKQNCSKSIGAWRIKMLHIRPKKHVHSRNLQACQNVGPPQFTVLSRCGRSLSRWFRRIHAQIRAPKNYANM